MSLGRRLFAKSGLIFMSRLIGAGIMFAVQVVIARRLGSVALGHYVVAVAAMNILAMLLPLGFQTIAAYFAAAYAALGHGQALRRFFLQALGQTGVMALVIFAVGPALRPGLGAPQGGLDGIWSALSLSALALAVLMLSGAVLTALKRPLQGFLGDALARPLVTAAALQLVMAAGLPSGMVVAHLFTWQSVGFAALALVWLFLASRAVAQIDHGSAASSGEQRQWWFFAAPWAIIALASDFFFDLDLLLLAPTLSLSDIAVFGIASRLFALAGFAVATVYAVIMPHMFEAEAQGHRHLFLARIRTANRVAAVFALVFLGAVPLLAPAVLAYLGPQFEQAAAPLAILCLILLIRAVFGPAAVVLSMERRPYLPLLAVALGFAVLVAGNVVLVPRFGLSGAAVSAVLAAFAWSASLWYLTLRVTGLDVSLWARQPHPPVQA